MYVLYAAEESRYKRSKTSATQRGSYYHIFAEKGFGTGFLTKQYKSERVIGTTL